MILLEINDLIRTSLFSIVILYCLFLFYKIARHPDKGYFLFMIFILLVNVFFSAVLELITLFYGYNRFRDRIFDILTKFIMIWICSLSVYQYSLLKAFKGKFREYPFKTFIVYAWIISIGIALLTNLKFFKDWHIGDIPLGFFTDMMTVLIHLFICIMTYRFRDEIKFGPYSIVRGSSSKLIKFSLIQALFVIIAFSLQVLGSLNNCMKIDLDDSGITYCAICDLMGFFCYQGWIWYAVAFNWKRIEFSSGRTSSESSDSESVMSRIAIRSTSFLSPDPEHF